MTDVVWILGEQFELVGEGDDQQYQSVKGKPPSSSLHSKYKSWYILFSQLLSISIYPFLPRQSAMANDGLNPVYSNTRTAMIVRGCRLPSSC